MHRIKESQNKDGSFGDILSTYYAVPTLSGRSFLWISKICPGKAGKQIFKKQIWYDNASYEFSLLVKFFPVKLKFCYEVLLSILSTTKELQQTSVKCNGKNLLDPRLYCNWLVEEFERNPNGSFSRKGTKWYFYKIYSLLCKILNCLVLMYA